MENSSLLLGPLEEHKEVLAHETGSINSAMTIPNIYDDGDLITTIPTTSIATLPPVTVKKIRIPNKNDRIKCYCDTGNCKSGFCITNGYCYVTVIVGKTNTKPLEYR